MQETNYQKKPDWLRVPYNPGAVEEMASLLGELGLCTVCTEASCPNLGECYRRHTATFMILGSHCTRNCRFCDVRCGKGEAPDPAEPEKIALAAKKLGLRHVVITCVTRDDLPDGGAGHFAAVVRALRKQCPGAAVELLISDLQGSEAALDTVLESKPDVLGHNMETVKRLYPAVRPQAIYERSLKVLSYCKRQLPSVYTKTGFMVGLGEDDEEIGELMDDILKTGCDILTVSQYLQPSKEHAPLRRYVTPEEFEGYKRLALAKGFRHAVSTPLTRSSYLASEAFDEIRRKSGEGNGQA